MMTTSSSPALIASSTLTRIAGFATPLSMIGKRFACGWEGGGEGACASACTRVCLCACEVARDDGEDERGGQSACRRLENKRVKGRDDGKTRGT